ncbi:MAG: A/G-specific adenine glycosylase [Sphingobium sp.]|jgi:A/G-specific adenine glycosylase|nr:A/G-specific adenine glycosylase [Sphingobium sp.]MCI1272127.1 A/G-specific adenine glycosylase [Sphingobium sp.]MCI1757153.1 A/G-specific adenine glycosylase [Sphingobium sp.]MCI2054255.1 A/G-specific adenine glycosylase [Sphingobium sp.]
MPVEDNMKAGVAAALLTHYDRHARALPWRVPPGSAERPDPYRVWLSEVMLQQTTVAAVIPYFAAFTTRWPTVTALASAEDAEVMAAWAGLGYYARARNLLACARVVAGQHGGRFPDTEEGLRALPGIGGYTAAAIAAIAFSRRAVVVDANVERVVSRLFAIEAPLPTSRPAIRDATDAITPERRAGDFAQAMMDLGSSLCLPRNPQCLLCPLRESCAAHLEGRAEAYPVKPPKKDKPHRLGRVWWLERADGYVWIERREAKRMLGGMTGLPTSAWDKRDSDKRSPSKPEPPLAGEWTALNQPVDHVFTHFRLTLTVERLRVTDARPEGAGQWWPLARIGEAGLPTLFAKVARAVMEGGDD